MGSNFCLYGAQKFCSLGSAARTCAGRCTGMSTRACLGACLRELRELREFLRAVHPMGETAKMRAAVSCHCLGPWCFRVKREIGRGRRGAPFERSVGHARQRTSSMPSLELCRRAIVERGMQALDVVDPLDEGGDGALSLAPVAVEGAVDLLGLERAHESARPWRCRRDCRCGSCSG